MTADRQTIRILNTPIDKVDMNGALARVREYLDGNSGRAIFTPGSEFAWLAYKDMEFREMLETSDMNIPDGIGIVLASRILGDRLPEKVAGIDLVSRTFALDYPRKLRVFLVGSKPGIAVEAAVRIVEQYPNVEITGVRDGFFKPEDEAGIVDAIAASGSDIALVALGMKKQEGFIHRNLTRMNVKIALGVGGTIDVFAGHVRLAPDFYRRNHLEWFYRLMRQPSRFVRMLALPKFLFTVIAVKLKLIHTS